MRGRKKVFFLTLGFLIGVSMLLYPTISNHVNSKVQSRAITQYEDVLKDMEAKDYSEVFQKARDYNKALFETDLPFHDYKNLKGYNDLLKVESSSILGYIEIDKIKVRLPIFHGTSDMVLTSGVGHLEGSSLPVGGKNTHSVLSAHRALPTSKLFTDLDRLEIGDTFEIRVLDKILTYQVDKVQVVTPEVIDDLQIVEGKDYCTLFTCTPYGINTHRLLVRGVRIENLSDKPMIYVANEAFRIEPLLVTPAVAAPMLLIFLIHLMLKYREPPKRARKKE